MQQSDSWKIWALLVIGLLVACTPETEPANFDAPPDAEADADVVARATDPRPSIVLVVLDTTRADAISAYGNVQGTTPTVDALASRGRRFSRAFAPSPWTVSSHASLFSGLRVDQHGVGLDGVFRSDDSLKMLAESLREEGYVTAGFAENSLVSPDFGLDQGFEHFEATNMLDVVQAQSAGEESMAFFSLASKVRDWNRRRDRTRPYFLFVNIMDAHDPYSVRSTNPWVPSGTERSELEFVAGHYQISSALCRNAPTQRDQALLRGLYLGDVSAADAKLGRVLESLEEGGGDERRITIVTADHGEHLGEDRLSGHRFSVSIPALHIPLIVTGVEDLEVGVSEQPVELRSVRQSVLCWSLGADCPAVLATDSMGTTERDPIFGIYSDRAAIVPEPVRDQLGIPESQQLEEKSRAACGPEDPVFGDLVSLIRYPMKINSRGDLGLTLYDLSWDPWERSDLMATQPEVAARLGAELEAFVTSRVQNREAASAPELSEDAARALKSLGYVE